MPLTTTGNKVNLQKYVFMKWWHSIKVQLQSVKMYVLYWCTSKKYVHFDRLKLNLWSTVILQVLYVKLQCRAEHCNLHCNKGQQLCASLCCFTVTLSYRHICCVKKCIITCKKKAWWFAYVSIHRLPHSLAPFLSMVPYSSIT